jgi:protein-L-isoaspartate(D-aspartate) O-methyltransferase
VRTGIGMTSQRTRNRLVQRLSEKGIEDPRVLEVIGRIPRHLFVEEAFASRAYEDTPLPIGHGQTISQPYIVALMTETLLRGGVPRRVLEVGTGSGYQAAVLAELGCTVYTVERISALHERATELFRAMGYRNLYTKLSDGTWGWAAKAPFDAIIVTAAPSYLPRSLTEQLVDGGRMLVPLGGEGMQQLMLYTRQKNQIIEENLGGVRFVPFITGQVQS